MSRAEVTENARRVEALVAPFVGTPLIEFDQSIRPLGCEVRVVVEDGRGIGVFMDHRPMRVNVVVARGIVTEIQSIG
jgi:hypothetical protein